MAVTLDPILLRPTNDKAASSSPSASEKSVDSPQQDASSTEGPSPTSRQELPPALIKVVEDLNNRAAENQQILQALADPTVRDALRARQEGRQVRVVDEKDSQQQTAPPAQATPPPDFETMTNTQIVDYLVKKIPESLDRTVNNAVGKQVSSLKQEIAPRLDQLNSEVQVQVNTRLSQEIATVKAAHPKDFDLMVPKMVELSKTVKGLSVEEVYQLAKLRSGLPPVTQRQVETERPTETPQRKTPDKSRNLRGRRGFDDLLKSALGE